jgi:hypothetical protein
MAEVTDGRNKTARRMVERRFMIGKVFKNRLCLFKLPPFDE